MSQEGEMVEEVPLGTKWMGMGAGKGIDQEAPARTECLGLGQMGGVRCGLLQVPGLAEISVPTSVQCPDVSFPLQSLSP